MNVDDDYNVAARYRTIRKHLDSLGYRQALSLDGLPLIEKLLADLIQTTDSLKHFKAVAHDNVEACSRLQLSIDPYKCDNARLVQECNQLHLDISELKESHQRQIKDFKRKIYKSEIECSDLQSASSRNLKRIKELESESSQKSKRIQELLGKCCKPLINNVGLASKKRPSYPLRRPSLEAEPLPRNKSNSSLPSLNKVEPRSIDLLAMADRKMNTLNQEVTRLKGELDLQVDSVYTLKTQLAIKEKEISRLKKMLEGGRPYSAVSRDCLCKKIDQCCDHDGFEKVTDLHGVCHQISDTTDMRMLQQVKSDLEQQLREALDKQHDAMSQAMKLAERNEELEKELRDIDHIALAVEADCNSAVKENNKRVSQLQEKLESVMTQVHVLEGELMVERRSAQELRADLEGSRLENRNLQRKLESTLDEKKHMNDRINQLTVIEQSLKLEIDKLARANENLKKEIVRLDGTNNLLKKRIQQDEISHSVKEDSKRVKEKGEKNDKNRGKILTKKKSASRGQRRSFSPPSHEKQTETARRYGDTRDDEVTRDSNIEATRMQKLNSDKDAKINHLQQTIDQIQTDRDYYKNEYNRLREQSVKNSEADNAELWGQVCELRRQLIDKEHAIIDLQREKKELSREKFELELRLQSSRSERRNPYHPCGKCRPIGSCTCSIPAPMAGGDSRASTAMVERLERERAAALADVDRLVEERDSLRERLKLAVEAHKFEQRRLRENLCDVENRVKKLERERQELLITQGTHRATIDGFENQLEDLRDELRRTKQELSTQRTQYFQLRTLQDQADQALGDVQGQLNHSESELYKAMDRNRLLEQQRIQLDNDVKELKQEISNLRGNMSRGDQEKDQLLMDLNEKNGRIAILERDLKAKDQEVSGAEQQLQELQHKYQVCVDQSAEQERRLRNMQMEMEIHQRQLAAASNDRDNAAQENRRLQDDLAAVTCEIRTLQRELETSRAESYDLKRQLQTYVSEVRRAEELINRKENERTEMLNHFRSLSLEATMLENNNHSLESEAAEARGALQSARDRSLDLERQLADRDCLIRGYETQISELTQTVASMETQIQQQMKQRQMAEADLNAVRDLCVKLDQQKENLAKELGDKDATKAQYEAQLARLKAEQNMIQDQLNRDRVTVERLETLLDQARQESMDSQTANQELQCEMSRMKQRMCELQNKLSSESAELRRYQNQSAEYSKQIGELRRQVTNERFDRARKEEEHRRNCHCGESSIANRNEIFSGDTSSPCPALTRRLDSNGLNVNVSPSPRYAQSGEEYRYRGDLRIEAQRTNRFNAPNVNKASAALTSCKCSESNSKILNADSTTLRGEQPRTKVSTIANDVSQLTNKHARRGSSACCALCVRATVEENDEHKDIRVRISDASAFVNFNGNTDKTAVVKFCTPLICKEATRSLTLPANDTSEMKTNESSSLPHTSESLDSREVKNSTEIIANEDKNAGGKTETSRSLSSKINKALRGLNCKGNGGKARADRDKTKNEEKTMDSSTESKSVAYSENDTSGYDTSRMTNFRTQSHRDSMENIGTTIESNCPEICEANNDSVTAADTLRILQRILENAAVESEVQRNRMKSTRSRSLPRERIRVCESDLARSNFTFPVRVDYSGAALTAADLTRPEFVQMLTEIKEQTRNLEKQLSQMNHAMRSTSFNDAVIDATKVETEKSKIPLCREKTVNNHFESFERLQDSVASDSRDGIAAKSIKATKNKSAKDSTSQSDFPRNDRIVTSTPLKVKKNERKFAQQDNKVDVGEPTFGLKGTKSDVNYERKNDKFVGTRQNIGIWTENEASADTQTPRSVDEAISVKPSQIHKLKKSPVVPPSPNRSTGTRPKTREGNSENSTEPVKRSRGSSPSSRIPGMMNWSPVSASRAGSLIPTRQTVREKPRSAPAAHSTMSRIAAGSSEVDLSQSLHPTTPVDNAQQQRERLPTRFSLRKLSSRGSSTSSQTRGNGVSSSPSPELRSRNNNFDRAVLIRDSIVSNRQDDRPVASDNRGQPRSEIKKIERTRTAPKSLEFGTMKKLSKEEQENALARRSLPDDIESSCTTDTWETSQGDLPNGGEKKFGTRKPRTPEAARATSRSRHSGRSIDNSSPARQTTNKTAKNEQRSSKLEQLRDERTINDRTASSGTSRSPARRSRKFESGKELFSTNYSSSKDRPARAYTAKDSNDENRQKEKNASPVYNNDKKLNVQQRSKSDSRERRNSVGRDSR